MIRPMARFRAIKIDKKCKHLSNFPAVTLQTLCKSLSRPGIFKWTDHDEFSPVYELQSVCSSSSQQPFEVVHSGNNKEIASNKLIIKYRVAHKSVYRHSFRTLFSLLFWYSCMQQLSQHWKLLLFIYLIFYYLCTVIKWLFSSHGGYSLWKATFEPSCMLNKDNTERFSGCYKCERIEMMAFSAVLDEFPQQRSTVLEDCSVTEVVS
jgi:hypothetical protein